MTAPAAPQTFESIYREHFSAVYRQALRYGGGDPHWAEDVAHDVFMKLLQALPRLRRARDLGGWLYRVTANEAVSRLRRRSSLLARLSDAWQLLSADTPTDSPEVVVLRHEAAKAALETLQSLPARERVVICMRLLEGRSQRDIAATLDLSEGYVSKLVARGVASLRQAGWEVDHG